MFKSTHVLAKDFVVTEFGDNKEIYKKGTPVFVPRLHRKHSGFCCNVALLTKTGRIKVNRIGALTLFSKDFFIPKKDWFI